VAQIFLNDVGDAVAEIQQIREAGLTGGVLLPVINSADPLPSLYSDKYDDLYAVCADLDLPIAQHATSAGDPSDAGLAIAYIEVPFFSNRSLWHLILGGVFERHPALKFVITEQYCGWIPGRLDMLDGLYDEARNPGTVPSKFCGNALSVLSMPPSEYWRRNCFAGTFMLPGELALRHDIGIDKMMWGSDFPHAEGTVPWTLEALRACYASLTVEETSAIVGATAAGLYGLDARALRDAADRLGPLVADVHVPLERWPILPDETQCMTFAEPTNAADSGGRLAVRGRALYPI
jgi:predicted TIM-barrel fold metal-dependent hydrolase